MGKIRGRKCARFKGRTKFTITRRQFVFQHDGMASLTLSHPPIESFPQASRRSAICTAFSAAPLRSWSPATNSASVRPVGSLTSLADAADEHFVFAARVDAASESSCAPCRRPARTPGAAARIARASADDSGSSQLDVERDAMRAQNGHAHAGRGDAQVRLAEDLARLLHHLGLFLVVAGFRIHLGVVREHVERIRMRQHLRRERTAFEDARAWIR